MEEVKYTAEQPHMNKKINCLLQLTKISVCYNST